MTTVRHASKTRSVLLWRSPDVWSSRQVCSNLARAVSSGTVCKLPNYLITRAGKYVVDPTWLTSETPLKSKHLRAAGFGWHSRGSPLKASGWYFANKFDQL
ncbi:hypothetical protein CDL15_Pgr016301 [Punica granatum]|uniref:Uncharacterized protein n=1 Tax=Punica granatum TaxID=22663 RepID=A0A218W7B3_PUNGR|nr:hypothetical protein CDL15_Pgr016301 [Punica granatum]